MTTHQASGFSQLAERLQHGEAVVAGVLSGTSADGIDVAIARTAPALAGLEPLAFETRDLPDELSARVRAVLDGEPCGLRASALLSRDLGRAFGAAAAGVAREHGLALELVGSHGQTVWHHDGAEVSGAATLQLGDGDFVAESAGCAVVSDFRQRDVAAGGEGAPLVGLVDALLFPSCTRPTALLNLGGMANLTLLVGGEAQLAFDTGPAGALLDGLARRLCGRDYDDGGRVALKGQPQAALVECVLEAPWFRREPPKSTGRDSFGEAYVDEFLARARAAGLESNEDVLASAVELVACSVARALCDWAPAGTEELVLAGGGVHNRALFAALERTSGCKVQSSAAHGVDPDAREALAFAALAAACVLERPTSCALTGARPGRVLGKWSAAPPAGTVPGATGPAEAEGERSHES